jgi:hypothetical protein
MAEMVATPLDGFRPLLAQEVLAAPVAMVAQRARATAQGPAIRATAAMVAP